MLKRSRGHMPAAWRRRGLTLVELLVVMVLLSIVAGGMLAVISGQYRFYGGSAGIIDTRGNVRQGIEALKSDLRSISPRLEDIVDMGRTFIELRVSTGTSVICSIDPGRRSIVVPPATLIRDNGLTSWITPPQTGDSLFVFNQWDKPAASDDRWDSNRVAAPLSTPALCPGNYTDLADAPKGNRIMLDDALDAHITPGSAIRFFRHARYELYEASDGKWYLGYKECRPGTGCEELLPVSGPYLPAAKTGPSGLELTYYDANGAVTTIPTDVKRIDMMVRAQSANPVNTPGHPKGLYQDSLGTTIAVRN